MDVTMKVRKVPSKVRTARCSSSSSLRTGGGRKSGRKQPRAGSATAAAAAAAGQKRCVCRPPCESPVEFSPVWEELRANGQLCDGVVRCEDDVEFRIHRAILSAVSPYFKALFTSSLNKGQPDTKEANVNVCSKVFKILLSYAYTGTCNIDQSNVENLLKYADQYEILGVVQMCCKFLLVELHGESRAVSVDILKAFHRVWHQALLNKLSTYILALFTSSLNKGQPDTKEANVNVCSKVFKILLSYAYTGTCNIDQSNVENLLKYADQYEILGVVQMCCKFLLDQLCPNNCLGILRFASQYFCKDLERKGRRYLIHNFTNVIKTSTEFHTLELKDFVDILTSDELNVKQEDVLLEAIRKWIYVDVCGRKCHLLELLKCLRLGNVNYDTIACLKTWPLVVDNEACRRYVRETVEVATEAGTASERGELTEHALFRPRVPHDVVFAVGGWSAGSPTNFVETYDVRSDRWLLSQDTDTRPRAYHGLCALHGLVYMIGGFDGNEYFNTVRSFDPVGRRWRECACMYHPRCYVSVVVHCEQIYALGGYNGRQRMKTAERYHPDTNQWELIPTMQKPRSDASAAVLKEKIYIVGGFDGQEVMNSVEVFDTLASQWSYVPHMTTARSGVSLVAFGSTLFAIGGFNGYSRLITGEKYTPGYSAVWCDIANMLTPRSNFATVTMDDYIYVIGGFNGSTTINYVEYYDPSTNDWYDAASMNLNRSALGACVISGLPNAFEYSVLSRNLKEEGQGAGAE